MIGDCDGVWIDETFYKIEFPGFVDWYRKADIFDPYSDVATFQTNGFEEWINQGYEYAVMLREMLPSDVDVYYGFWKDFGDKRWIFCKAYIVKK
jgi:hypothetical protein